LRYLAQNKLVAWQWFSEEGAIVFGKQIGAAKHGDGKAQSSDW
jgi:hypothetical protein